MIKNIAQLLKGIMDEESKKLDIFKLKHAPTIGKMYEGLIKNEKNSRTSYCSLFIMLDKC